MTLVTKVLFSFQNEASEVGDETLILTDETVVHEKTLEIHDNEKTIEAHENELNEEKVEKVTSVDEPEVQVDEAPLASMESDPAPLASLDSATSSELQSMWKIIKIEAWMNEELDDHLLCIFVTNFHDNQRL